MLKVGLTGGIGSGKSTVAERLAGLGAGVVDADLLSRELTEPGSAALEEMASVFGREILTSDGALDRSALRVRAFADPAMRARLESILHPRIRALMSERVAALSSPYAILVVPLLLETGQDSLVDRVLVVDVPEEVQVQRVQKRSGLPPDEIGRIMSSQIGRAERLAHAHDVIDNSGPSSALGPQIDALHQLYLSMAKNRPAQAG